MLGAEAATGPILGRSVFALSIGGRRPGSTAEHGRDVLLESQTQFFAPAQLAKHWLQ